MFQLMDTPRSRSEFEYRLAILLEQIQSGKLKFAAGLSLSRMGLEQVRYLPNRRIDLLSVNEFARLKANMAVNMAEMQGALKSRNDSAAEAGAEEAIGENRSQHDTASEPTMPTLTKAKRRGKRKAAESKGRKMAGGHSSRGARSPEVKAPKKKTKKRGQSTTKRNNSKGRKKK
jgi:hypothetical protein